MKVLRGSCGGKEGYGGGQEFVLTICRPPVPTSTVCLLLLQGHCKALEKSHFTVRLLEKKLGLNAPPPAE
jgi:hypothetical protein